MKLIRVYELVGESCLTPEDGHKIYDLIYPELKAGREVELDFDKVKKFASPCLNFSIGRLLKDIKPDDLNRLFKVANLVPEGHDVLKRVIENSKQYYSDDNARKAQDDVLLEQGEDL